MAIETGTETVPPEADGLAQMLKGGPAQAGRHAVRL
jgi:hypothetical protein